jgi:hypothetical protein
MPKMLGDDPYNQLGTSRWGLMLTSTQLAVLDAWQNGKFIGVIAAAAGGLSRLAGDSERSVRTKIRFSPEAST